MKKSDWQPQDFIAMRDLQACLDVCALTESELTTHKNPDFKINVIKREEAFYRRYAKDIFKRLVAARDQSRAFVAILPVGPVKQYSILADMINQYRLPLGHAHIFLMDEYALPDGREVPENFPFSFKSYMLNNFFRLVDPALHPPLSQIHAPGRGNINGYAQRIADLGGAEVVYGGIGWSGHVAFIDPVAESWGGLDDLDAFLNQGPRFCRLSPQTAMHAALRAFDAAYHFVPAHAYSIGPAQIRDAAHRSFWCDGHPWQNFIWRLAAHGPVTPRVPASMLQLWPGEINLIPSVMSMDTLNWGVIRDYFMSLPD